MPEDIINADGSLSDYAQSMLDKSNGAEEENTLLAGKYENEAELLKGLQEVAKTNNLSLEDIYKTIESGIGSQDATQETLLDKLKNSLKQSNEEPEGKTSKDKESSKISLSVLETEKLTEELTAKLLKAGYSQTDIDTYAMGVQAKKEAEDEKLLDMIGGKEVYQQLKQWALLNVPMGVLDAFNKVMAEGDTLQKKEAIITMYAKYNAGRKPLQDIFTPSINVQGGAPYTSEDELQADIQNPKYKTDPRFRKQVMNKLRASKLV